MRKVFLVAMLMAGCLLSVRQGSFSAGQETTEAGGAAARESMVKVKITTGGGLYGPVKSQYKVGEEIPVVISLTNTTDKPIKYCLSTFVFQNRLRLKRDGQVLPHRANLYEQAEKDEYIQRCETSAARQFYDLPPKESRVVDWFTLGSGGIDGYGRFQAGRYELILERRIECCQGPFVESDKISFDVVP